MVSRVAPRACTAGSTPDESSIIEDELTLSRVFRCIAMAPALGARYSTPPGGLPASSS